MRHHTGQVRTYLRGALQRVAGFLQSGGGEVSTGMGSFSTVGSPPWKPSWSRSGSETRSVPGALLPPGWVWRHSGKQETSPESSSSPDVRLLGGISMTHLKTHGCLCKSHRQETVQEEMFTGAFETHVESKSYHNPNPCCQKGADVSNCRHPTAAPEPGPVVWQVRNHLLFSTICVTFNSP